MAEHPPSRASINTLPNEILESIVHAVRHNSPKDLVSLLRVSSVWYELGLPLVWHDVVLTKSNIASFAGTLSKYPHLPQRITSLSLNIRLSYDEYSLTYKVADHIKRLSRVLHEMRCLTTFSFKHHVDQSSPYPASAMTNDLILNLVCSLPAGLQRLEIDSPVMYFTQHVHGRCLCSILSERFHELHSLRLAYPRLCWKLLQHPSNTLRYLVINAVMTNFRPGLRGCNVNGEQARLSWDALQEQRIITSIDTVRTFLETVHKKVVEERSFPQLKTLLILEPYYFPTEPSLNFFSTNIHSISNEDPTRIITRCYPTWANDCWLHFVLRQCAHLPREKNKATSLASHHNCSTEDVGGSYSKLRSMLEGEAGWSTIKYGRRHPRYVLPTSTPKPEIESNQYPGLRRYSTRTEDDTETTFRYLEHLTIEDDYNAWSTDGNVQQDPARSAQILANQVWRAEADARRPLVCGRIYVDGVPESLEAADFTL
ncbi:hypothetical protein H2198_004750 [Neophaeococcomyces mojaviensis]|uniref:Uncharacterized protein n=1 Tax=Neophaeococcomyces mojaviensis TaxID=3383035 RepID=A0ACC3A7P9_9EURO|nr:hypothetical protein H2198_004750 [Knufia sp. JES_112]